MTSNTGSSPEAGRSRHVHELGEPIVDSTGRLVRSIGTLQDITERNHTEEVLRPSRDELEERVKERTVERRARETRLKQAAQTAKLGHWCFDEIGKAYISVSEEYASLFGYTVEEFLERFRALDRDMVLVHEADREKFSRRTKSVKIGGRLPHRPVRWKRASSA
jgi:PAS domain-containing protein